MTEEYRQSEVTFKYYLPDNQDDLTIHIYARKMYLLLCDIDDRCRNIVKWDQKPEQTRNELAEEIRDMIMNQVDLDMVR